MRYISTRHAKRLTGLSTATLREWTNRRALIPADVPPKTRGSPAQYSWQAILLLRVAATLRDRFHVELKAQRTGFADLRRRLRGTSFIALRHKVLALHGESWSVLDDAGTARLHDDAVVIRLDPHLLILADGFAPRFPSTTTGQHNLFPAIAMREPAAIIHRTEGGAARRRKSA